MNLAMTTTTTTATKLNLHGTYQSSNNLSVPRHHLQCHINKQSPQNKNKMKVLRVTLRTEKKQGISRTRVEQNSLEGHTSEK